MIASRVRKNTTSLKVSVNISRNPSPISSNPSSPFNATVIRTLNAVSARLTLAALLDLNVSLTHESVTTVARDWLRQAGLTAKA